MGFASDQRSLMSEDEAPKAESTSGPTMFRETFASLSVLLFCVLPAAWRGASAGAQSPSTLPRPSGQEWSLWGQDGQTVAFGRRTSQGVRHTILASATLLSPGGTIGDSMQLLNYVRETQATRSGSDPQRFTNIDYRASINNDLNPGCVREDGVEEDHRVPAAPGLIFVVVSREYFCLHPLSTETSPLLVQLSVSQRYVRGGQPLPIDGEVEPFFRSYLEGSTLPLLKAAKTDDLAMMQASLARGINVNTRSDVSSDWGKTALMEASLRGYADVVKALLDIHADVNARDDYGETALMFAAGKGHAAIVGLLLTAGADVSARTPKGTTALILASKRGYLAAARPLLEAGADVNAADPGGTALTFAAWKGAGSLVQALIERGADVNARSATGTTALMYVAANGDAAVVRALIQTGADVNARDNDGHTVLEFAKRHSTIVELLREAGATQ